MAVSNHMRRMLGASVSLGALCVLAAPVGAQTAAAVSAQTATASDNAGQATPVATDAGGKEIVVTGVRKALETARLRKRNADTVIDSISATDIGAFPDKSVAEALQRVPGISVSRFAINTDTAHFTTEPSGVLVRGLPQVRSEFNGRDSFSASGGRALSWGDVPVELLGGVDVYKNQTADLIEGGIAGSVNLRTRLPFDSNQQLILIGARANYGDIGKKVTPDLNAFYSNRWQTGIGEFGIMGDLAYSDVKTGSEGLQSYRAGIFTGGMIPGSADAQSVFGKGTVVIPSSLSYLDDRFNRKRTGITAAAQWRSDDQKWLATAQYIRSNYKNSMDEHGIGVGLFGFPGTPAATFRFAPGDGNAYPNPAPGTPDFTFDQNGFMDHGTFDTVNGVWWGGDAGTALNSDGQPMLHSCTNANMGWGIYNSSDSNQQPGYCPAGFNHNGDSFSTNSRIQQSSSMTQDMSLNIKWDPSSVLHFNFDGQYIDSTATFYDAEMSFQSYANPELSGLGSKPRIIALNPGSNVFLSPGGYANPDNYTVSSLADQNQDNRGHE